MHCFRQGHHPLGEGAKVSQAHNLTSTDKVIQVNWLKVTFWERLQLQLD